MNIHSATIENFKKIEKCEFEAKGNHITLKGMNGSGKSSILETLLLSFFGKKLLPDDPVRHGQESAKITWNIGNGEKVVFTITVKIKGDSFTLNVMQYGINGQKMEIKSPAAFLESIMFRDALDPQAFFAKDDKEQLKMLYTILPGLKEKLDAIDAEYKAVQEKRSIIKSEGEKAKVNFDQIEYYPGLPEIEVDPAELMQKLSEAQAHNSKKTGFVNAVNMFKNQVQHIDSKISAYNESLTDIDSEIERLKNKKVEIQARITETENSKGGISKELETAVKNLSLFQEIPTAEIEEQIKNANETNRKIRSNKARTEFEKQIEKKREEYSSGLQEMRKLEEKRVEIVRSAQMPIAGLTVGEGCLMFPDPVSGEIVKLNSLSTGQKWRVAVQILAAFLPENGMRVMVVKNLNDLDESNYTAMLQAADELGVQLVMHQTVFKADNAQCQIVISD